MSPAAAHRCPCPAFGFAEGEPLARLMPDPLD